MKNSKEKKVLVALSGGVDSSVAAAMLISQSVEQGYIVEGAYMQCWSKGPYCSTEKDRADAARAAAYLDIPFRVFDFEKEYRQAVLDYFFSEYKAGRTPNPDVMCNKEIKFGIFLKEAVKAGFDYIATGHYARISQYQAPSIRYQEGNGNGRSRAVSIKNRSLGKFKLLAASDPEKDQSYFLYNLTQEQLSKVLFPIGDYKKSEVRKLAKRFGLATANKPDSQGICFIGPVNISDFLRETIKSNPGDVVDLNGKVIGKHDGLAFYTIGQREGIGVSKPTPYYVVEKDLDTNKLVVAPIGSEKLFKSHLEASEVHWINGVKPKIGEQIKARIRYRQPLVEAELEDIKKSTIRVKFKEEQKAVTPGQSIVFYKERGSLRSNGLKDSHVLGGAVIN